MSQIVVQKFGGSSVADAQKIRQVAERVKVRRDQGWQMVVVVSAMGDTTDELLSLAKEISADPPRRELDMLLTCGERISMALLSMALHEIGVPAISFTGSQSGIITDSAHAQARIIEVKPGRIEEELARGKVVIVAGYQGVSKNREVTTLGRGGSDTTAVALAAALGADCEIYSDVDGIFSADPRVVPDAGKLETVSFDEMQELAAAGAKVLNAHAVEFAREKGIVIHARATAGGGSGTSIQAIAAASRVKGITSEGDVWVFATHQSPQVLLEWLDAHQARGRNLLWDETGRVMAVVPLHDLHGTQTLKAQIPSGISLLEDCGTVTCVGHGLNADWSICRKAFSVAGTLGVRIVGSYSSALQLTLIVNRRQVKEFVSALHRALID